MHGEHWLSVISNVIVGLAVGAAAIIAWRGLNTWRSELRGRSEYELARRILASVVRTRDAIHRLRRPFMTGLEYSDRPGHDPDKKVATPEDILHAYQKRWEPVAAASRNVDVEMAEAEVLWGDLLRPAHRELTICANTIWIHVTRHVQLEAKDSAVEHMKPKKIQETRSIVFDDSTSSKPDDFARTVNDAATAFRQALRPYLGRGAGEAPRSVDDSPGGEDLNETVEMRRAAMDLFKFLATLSTLALVLMAGLQVYISPAAGAWKYATLVSIIGFAVGVIAPAAACALVAFRGWSPLFSPGKQKSIAVLHLMTWVGFGTGIISLILVSIVHILG